MCWPRAWLFCWAYFHVRLGMLDWVSNCHYDQQTMWPEKKEVCHLLCFQYLKCKWISRKYWTESLSCACLLVAHDSETDKIQRLAQIKKWTPQEMANILLKAKKCDPIARSIQNIVPSTLLEKETFETVQELPQHQL